MNVIIANFSDDSIALIQWAKSQNLSDVHILYCDTNWASDRWQKRLLEVKKWLDHLGFKLHILKPTAGFKELVLDRASFPSIKFQWCPGFLKGLPILDWLDQYDENEEGIILMPHRRSMSKLQANLPEFIEESEHFSDRKLWYPLFQNSQKEIETLVLLTPFELILTRSEECQACIFSTKNDLKNLHLKDIEKIKLLEEKIQKPMFNPQDYDNQQSITDLVENLKTKKITNENHYDQFAMGCGWTFGCGL